MADQVKNLRYWRGGSAAIKVAEDVTNSKRRVRFRVPSVPRALLVSGEQCVLRCSPLDNPPSSSSTTSSDSPVRTSADGNLLAGSNTAEQREMANNNQHLSSSSSSCCSPMPRPSIQHTFSAAGRVLPPSMSTSSSTSSRYRCLCGGCHVVIGTKCFLVLYIWLTLCGLAFGMVAASVWALIPLIVIPISAYGLCNHKPKYLYPLLIVTIIQLLVCLIMVVIVGIFALFNYNTLLAICAHSTARKPSSVLILVLLVTILGCLLLSGFFFWQVLVISSCIQYYECWQRRYPPQTSNKASKFNNTNDRLPTAHSIGGAMTGDGTHATFSPIDVDRRSCIENSVLISQAEVRKIPPDNFPISSFQIPVNHSVLTLSTTFALSQPNASPSQPDLTICESKS